MQFVTFAILYASHNDASVRIAPDRVGQWKLINAKIFFQRQKSQQHLLIFDSVDKFNMLQYVLHEGSQIAYNNEHSTTNIYYFRYLIIFTSTLFWSLLAVLLAPTKGSSYEAVNLKVRATKSEPIRHNIFELWVTIFLNIDYLNNLGHSVGLRTSCAYHSDLRDYSGIRVEAGSSP